mgnify:CR=1 FL=1
MLFRSVFSDGRIAQRGAPAEVYEHPATAFVAGFVGTSNLLADEAARAILGSDGTWSIRPEKIRVGHLNAAVVAGDRSARGTLREVVYVGMSTRYVVDLESGGTLMAVRQNSDAGAESEFARGASVILAWSPRHEYRVDN